MPQKLSRSEQSRLNGARSKGPTSPAGKLASSANALKHGFAASINVVLSIEDKPAFADHCARFRADFLPTNYVEQTLVDQLASINWRQSRLAALETSLIDLQISRQFQDVLAAYPGSDHDTYFHMALAWQILARSPKPETAADDNAPDFAFDHNNAMELLRRYQVSLDRQYRNALLNLRQYRKDFAPEPPAAPAPDPTAPPPQHSTPNEPKPHPPAAPKTPPPPTPIRPSVISITPNPPADPLNKPMNS